VNLDSTSDISLIVYWNSPVIWKTK